MRNKHFKRGFTLIELMVVILILAILAALIVPRVIGHSTEAKRSKAAADIATLRESINRFRLNCDRFPTTEEGLDALISGGDIRGWSGPYLDKELPPDPWGNAYVYEDLGNDLFTVKTYGKDASPGGTGEDADIPEDGSSSE